MLYSLHGFCQALLDTSDFRYKLIDLFNRYNVVHVNCIVQDNTGFLWLGTDNGLFRYDGGAFKQYRYAPGNANLLSNDYITSVTANDKYLFIGTRHGLNVLNFSTDSISNFFSTEGNSNYLGGNFIMDVCSYGNKVWVVSNNFILTEFDPEKKTFRQFPFTKPQVKTENYIYNGIRKILPDVINPDILWISSTFGLYQFNIKTGSNQLIRPPRKGYFNTQILQGIDICQTKDGVLWMGGEILNLVSYNPASREWNYYPIKPVNKVDLGNTVVVLIPWSQDYLLLFTGGVRHQMIFDINKKKFIVLTDRLRNEGNKELVYQPTGLSVYKDHNGTIWFGHGNGFSRIITEKNPFTYYDFPLRGKSYIVNNFQQVFFENTKYNHLLIGTIYGDGLLLQNLKNDSMQIIHSSVWRDTMKYDVIIRDITEDEDENFILATQNGLFRWREGDKHFVPYSDLRMEILTVTKMKNGYLYLGTKDSGLIVFNPADQSVIHRFLKSETELYDNTVTVLHCDNNNNLWVGTNSGVNILYNDETGIKRIDNKTLGLVPKDILRVIDIKHDRQNRIWISSTNTGIFCLTKTNNIWDLKSFNTSNALPDNYCGKITFDKNGHLWTGLISGIVRIIPETFTITLFNTNDGLGFNNRVSTKYTLTNGRVILSANRSYEYFYPDSLIKQAFVPQPYISSFTTPGNDKKFFTEIFNHLPIVLPYSQNRFEVDLGVLDFTSNRKIQFEYRLLSYDKKWTTTFSRNYLNFLNLPPGDYTLEFTAINLKAPGEKIIRQQRIIILKAWWQTWWFRILCALLGGTILYALWKNEKNKNNRKQQIREKEQKLVEMNRQMNETRLMAIRAQMNPHFIFNSLNSIQKFIVVGDIDSSYQYLSKFSKLLRQVLDNSEKDFIPLRQEIEMNHLYLELESLRFKNSFEYKFHFNENIDPDAIFIPSLLLQPFIENAIWHGLMNKEGDKKLEISFSIQNNHLECDIRDNGVGRKQAAFIKSQKLGSQYFESKGTRLSKQRIELINEQISGKAVIIITDLKNNNGDPAGTKVVVQLPLTLNHFNV
jgi:ligand-binding sensor domain-containing protein